MIRAIFWILVVLVASYIWRRPSTLGRARWISPACDPWPYAAGLFSLAFAVLVLAIIYGVAVAR